MRLTSEQTKRIMECIAKEMGITLPGKLHLGNYEKIVINDCGLKFVCRRRQVHEYKLLGEIITGKNDFYLFPWKPEEDELYYYPSPETTDGVSYYHWGYEPEDYRIQERVGIYRTKEEALQKARELGWVE